MAHGIEVGRKRVERLMVAAGISGLVTRKRGRTTVRVQGVRVADDLVERQFRPEERDVLWIADFSYLRTWEGWLYLAAAQDAFSRRIVGWSMADHMREELVINALQMALRRRRPAPGVIHQQSREGSVQRRGVEAPTSGTPRRSGRSGRVRRCSGRPRCASSRGSSRGAAAAGLRVYRVSERSRSAGAC